MKKTLALSTIQAGTGTSSQSLRCRVTVESTAIDFLPAGASLVAGSTDNPGCSNLPMPPARPRRGLAFAAREC